MQQIPAHGGATEPGAGGPNGLTKAKHDGIGAVGSGNGRGDAADAVDAATSAAPEETDGGVGGLGEPCEVRACDVERRGPGHGVEALALASHLFF